MATITWFDGFEHATFSDAGTGLYTETTAHVPAAATSPVYSGTYSMQCNGNDYLRWNNPHPCLPATGDNAWACRFRFRVTAAPSGADQQIVKAWTVPFHEAYLALNTSLGLYAHFNGTSYGSEQTIVADTWYEIAFCFDCTTATWKFDWSVDGSAKTQRTMAEDGTSGVQNAFLGCITNPTVTSYFDDFVVSHTPGDHPLGDYKVLGYAPNGVGTHSIDVGSGSSAYFLTDSGALSLPDTTSYQRLDDVPLSGGTDYVGIQPSGGGTTAVDPDADVTTTGWTTTPLWSKVNDDSDGTYITATAS